jgi:uncharacterized protein with PIN domain
MEPPCFCPLGTPRFVCDEMLKGLAEWLRVAGYDTRMAVCGSEDRTVLAMAVHDDRWLVTCDRELLCHRRGPEYTLLLDSDNLRDQIRELTWRMDLDWLHAPFSRCKRCNTPLRDGAAPESGSLPEPGMMRLCHCPSCRQSFWEGSHVHRMRSRLQEFSQWRRS